MHEMEKNAFPIGKPTRALFIHKLGREEAKLMIWQSHIDAD